MVPHKVWKLKIDYDFVLIFLWWLGIRGYWHYRWFFRSRYFWESMFKFYWILVMVGFYWFDSDYCLNWRMFLLIIMIWLLGIDRRQSNWFVWWVWFRYLLGYFVIDFYEIICGIDWYFLVFDCLGNWWWMCVMLVVYLLYFGGYYWFW